MHFHTKNTLKSNNYYIIKHVLNQDLLIINMLLESAFSLSSKLNFTCSYRLI